MSYYKAKESFYNKQAVLTLDIASNVSCAGWRPMKTNDKKSS